MEDLYTYIYIIYIYYKLCVHISNRSSGELLLTPVIVSRNEKEKVLIEGSVNSIRVSIAIKQVFPMLLWLPLLYSLVCPFF